MELEIYNYRRETTNHAERDFGPSTCVVWANTQFATVGFLCLSFFGSLDSRTGRAGGQILAIYASYDVFLGNDVPFGGCVDMVRHLGGQIRQKTNPNFGGLNRHFQAKRAKYENLHQNHCTDFNQILNTDKDHQVRWSKHAFSKSKMADGRHLEKQKNRNFSATA